MELERGKNRGFSRVMTGGPRVVRSGGVEELAGRVGSGQEVIELSRVGSGGIRSGRVGSGRVGSGDLFNAMDRAGSP